MSRANRAATVAVALLAGALASACSQKTAASGAPPAKAAVAADVDGAAITWDEMDSKANERLVVVRQEEYEARRDALDALIDERLIRKEAAARGLSRERLLEVEVDFKTPLVRPAEVDSLYQANKDRFPGRTQNEAQAEVERALKAQGRMVREAAFRQELRRRARISVKLEPPRLAVALPASAPAIGPDKAPVTMVEFSDYQCPYCHRAQQTVEELLKQYQGKLRWVHREFPLPNHPRAFAAARAARCANDQGRFWDYHRNLLTQPSDYADQDLSGRASRLGLDGPAFTVCLASDRHDAAINAARDSGQRIGVNATPTFLINGRMINGALPIEEFQRVLDEELARAGS